MKPNSQCDIARDLMPLSIDGVCSEGSQRFLETHLSECPPCRTLFDRMKGGNLPNMKVEPVQEAQALKQGLRWLGRRFKALWLTLAALACAFVLLLVAAGVNQIVRNWVSTAPLSTYYLKLFSNDAKASVDLSATFYGQAYHDYQCEQKIVGKTDENHTDAKEAVILTYSVSYFPNQAKEFAKDEARSADVQPFMTVGLSTIAPTSSPTSALTKDAQLSFSTADTDYHFYFSLDRDKLCVDNGKLYLLEGMEGIQTTVGRTLMLLKPGLPVSEIRVTDGKETRTLYTWGDEITNANADWIDENGLPQSGFISPSDYERLKHLIK